MHTLLVVVSTSPVPPSLQRIIEEGSSSVEVASERPKSKPAADRVLVWTGTVLDVGGQLLLWPDDESEMRMLLQAAGEGAGRGRSDRGCRGGGWRAGRPCVGICGDSQALARTAREPGVQAQVPLGATGAATVWSWCSTSVTRSEEGVDAARYNLRRHACRSRTAA